MKRETQRAFRKLREIQLELNERKVTGPDLIISIEVELLHRCGPDGHPLMETRIGTYLDLRMPVVCKNCGERLEV